MIEMQVIGIALDTRTGSPIVVLNDMDNRRALPIWIGSAEASAIIRQMENIKSARPMTHDLMYNIITETGHTLERIEINDLSTDTYYASMFLKHTNGEVHVIDSRPSDAIALALRANAPIFCTAHVVADGTISTDQERDEVETEEFRQFVQDIKPSDFGKLFNDEGESNS